MYPLSSSNEKIKTTEPPCPSSKNSEEYADRKLNHQNLLNSLSRLKEGLGIDLFQQFCEAYRKGFLSWTPFLVSEEFRAQFKDRFNSIQDFVIEFAKLDDKTAIAAAILLILDSRCMKEDDVQQIFEMFDMLVLDLFNAGEKYLDYKRLKEKYDLDRIRGMSSVERWNVFDTLYSEVNRIFSGHDDLIYVFKRMIEFDDYYFGYKTWVINTVGLLGATDINMDMLNLMRDAAWLVRDQESKKSDETFDAVKFLNESNLRCLMEVFSQDPFFPISVMLRKHRLDRLENAEVKWMKGMIRVLTEERDSLRVNVAEISSEKYWLSKKLFSSVANAKELDSELKHIDHEHQIQEKKLVKMMEVDKKRRSEIESLKHKLSVSQSKTESAEKKLTESLAICSEVESDLKAQLLEDEKNIRLLTKENERLRNIVATVDYKMSWKVQQLNGKLNELKEREKRNNKLNEEKPSESTSKNSHCDGLLMWVVVVLCISFVFVYDLITRDL